MLTLVTGGIRSGKSAFAERLAAPYERVIYVATACVDATDPESLARIARHRERRDASWRTIETGAGKPSLLEALASAAEGELLLIDSLGSWIAAAMFAREATIDGDVAGTVRALQADVDGLAIAAVGSRASIVLVSEEVGYGLVAPSVQGRIFQDVLGSANQRFAGIAQYVYLVVAGIALDVRALSAFASD